MRRSQNRKERLSQENFINTLKGTWEHRYIDVVKHHPEAEYIYRAIKLLQLASIELHFSMVSSVAELIASGDKLTTIFLKLKINRTLIILEKAEGVLEPRDGQIEACKVAIELDPYIESLGKLLFNHSSRGDLLSSFQGFAFVLCERKLSLELAEQLILAAIKEDPNLSTALTILGTIYLAQGHKKDAIEVFHKSNEMFPGCYVPWQRLIQEGEIQEGQEAFNKSLQTRTSKSAQKDNWVLLGYTYQSKELFSQAVDAYKKAIELDPQDVITWGRLGEAYYFQGKANEAIDALRKALEIDPMSIDLWNNISVIHREQKHFDEEMKAYIKLIELEPNKAKRWLDVGKLYNDLEKHDDAFIAINKAIELDPLDSNLYHLLGHNRSDKDQGASSIEAFKKAIEIKPDDDGYYNCLGVAYAKFDQPENAILAFDKAIELNPKEAMHFARRGTTYFLMKNFHEAIQDLK